MQEKLNRLFYECVQELKSIGIDISNIGKIGEINISISKRATKRYGCCKQEEPDTNTVYYLNRKRYYRKFKKHYIEISKWLMNLNDDIIKNTIIHELIHCIPDCNNHGKEFKKYAKYINENLGYNISRLGDKKADYRKSNLEYKENDNTYKYKITCIECNQLYYRQRMIKNFFKKYRCGKCNGKLTFADY